MKYNFCMKFAYLFFLYWLFFGVSTHWSMDLLTRRSRFDKAFDYVVSNEGGYVNDPLDRGGETRFGISKKHNPHVDVRTITLEQAKVFYYKEFWSKCPYDKIKNMYIAIKIFDLAVSLGYNSAYLIVQRALRAVGLRIEETGILDDQMLAYINSVDEASLRVALRAEAAGYYRRVVMVHPEQEKFLKGWLNRAYL